MRLMINNFYALLSMDHKVFSRRCRPINRKVPITAKRSLDDEADCKVLPRTGELPTLCYPRLVKGIGLSPPVKRYENGKGSATSEKDVNQGSFTIPENCLTYPVFGQAAVDYAGPNFSPPRAPHFGGVFEIMVKAINKALYAVLGSNGVTDEELITACAGVKRILVKEKLVGRT